MLTTFNGGILSCGRNEPQSRTHCLHEIKAWYKSHFRDSFELEYHIFGKELCNRITFPNYCISAGYKAKTPLYPAETIKNWSVSADNRANNALGRFVNKEAHSLKEEKDTDCLNSDIMPICRIQKVLQLVKYRILLLGLFVEYRI